VLKQAHIPYILAFHLQIDAVPDPAYNVDADAVSPYHFDKLPVLSLIDLSPSRWEGLPVYKGVQHRCSLISLQRVGGGAFVLFCANDNLISALI